MTGQELRRLQQPGHRQAVSPCGGLSVRCPWQANPAPAGSATWEAVESLGDGALRREVVHPGRNLKTSSQTPFPVHVLIQREQLSPIQQQ